LPNRRYRKTQGTSPTGRGTSRQGTATTVHQMARLDSVKQDPGKRGLIIIPGPLRTLTGLP